MLKKKKDFMYKIVYLKSEIYGTEIMHEKCYRYFRFKSWYGPAIQIQTLNGLMETNSLAVNDLTREQRKRCEGS